MKPLTIVVILLALAGCQSAEDIARARVEEANAKMNADAAACRTMYPVERNTVINRVRCMNDAHSAYPHHRYPDLVAVFNAERLIAAERFRDGKTSEAQYDIGNL
jgi:type III secretory pathway lipoprotein EscJ